MFCIRRKFANPNFPRYVCMPPSTQSINTVPDHGAKTIVPLYRCALYPTRNSSTLYVCLAPTESGFPELHTGEYTRVVARVDGLVTSCRSVRSGRLKAPRFICPLAEGSPTAAAASSSSANYSTTLTEISPKHNALFVYLKVEMKCRSVYMIGW